MGQRKTQFANEEIYHLAIRAIEDLWLFRDKRDYLRMIYYLFEFNDTSPIVSTFRQRLSQERTSGSFPATFTAAAAAGKDPDVLDVLIRERKKEPLVEILAFCLMPNHLHLLTRQLREKGISKFMQKLGGYATYYNKRYERKGHLFQGKFRAVHVRTNEQLKTVFVYIHSNPLAIIFPGWKEKGIPNLKKAIEFVEGYKWSSCADYLGKKNFPFLTSRRFLIEAMDGLKGYREFVNDWLSFKRELAGLDELALE